MEKMAVFYEGIMKGKSKKTEQPYQLARFFQIVTNKWGTSKRDVVFGVGDEMYEKLEKFVEEHKCIIGDVLEIGVKVSKDLTRPPKLVSVERVIEKSPLIKYAVTDIDDDYDQDDVLDDEIPQFVKVGEKK